MNFLMFHKVASLAKGFSALIASIWFLASMNSLMLNKMGPLTKGFPTFITLIGFFSGVNSLMLSKRWTLNEAFSTLIAFIRFISSMNSLMVYKVFTPAEGFFTFITFVGLFPSMCSLMANKSWTITKSFPTFVALTRFLFFNWVCILFGACFSRGLFWGFFLCYKVWTHTDAFLRVLSCRASLPRGHCLLSDFRFSGQRLLVGLMLLYTAPTPPAFYRLRTARVVPSVLFHYCFLTWLLLRDVRRSDWTTFWSCLAVWKKKKMSLFSK